MMLNKAKPILVIGCGSLGAAIAVRLSRQGYSVTVLDREERAFQRLPEDFDGGRYSCDATHTQELEELGIRETELLVAVTGDDNTNRLLALLASSVYHLPKVYISLKHEGLEELFTDRKVEILYPNRLAAEEFERLSAVDCSEVRL